MAFVTRRSGEREIRSRMDGDGSGDEAATRLSAEWKEVAEIHAAKKADLQRQGCRHMHLANHTVKRSVVFEKKIQSKRKHAASRMVERAYGSL